MNRRKKRIRVKNIKKEGRNFQRFKKGRIERKILKLKKGRKV